LLVHRIVYYFSGAETRRVGRTERSRTDCHWRITTSCSK